jgi:hypothetical protein
MKDISLDIMAGAAEVYPISVPVHATFVLIKKYESYQQTIQPSCRAPVHIIPSRAHMSSTPLVPSPPLRQTTHLLRAHLPCALADIAEDYLLPKDMESTWQIVEAGHYELCMEVRDTNVGLVCACHNGHMDIVRLMIAKGASNWKWGLSSACRNGHMNIVQLMIATGARDWNWGLSSACYNGHMDIIQLMIDKGASDWNLGLSSACLNSHMDIVQLMIAKGATTCTICDNSKHSFAS